MTENPMKTTREKDRSPLVSEQLFIDTSKPYEKRRENDSTAGGSILPSLSPDQQWLLKTSTEAKKSPEPSINSPISPRRRRAKEREEAVSKVITFVTSPVPYLTLGILVAMIIMIFVDILPISALLCISAILMIVTIVLGSHWRGLPVWNDIEVPESENDANKRYSKRKNEYQSLLDNHKFQPLTREERQDNLNDFFEEIFKAIDYSLLVIFLGTFIVIENMNSTGVPGFIW